MPHTNKRSNSAHRQVAPFKRAVKEAGYSYSSMRDAHFRGELAVIRVGRAWYIELAELARFTERHTQRPAE